LPNRLNLKIATWNTAGRTRKISDQWNYLKSLNLDILCLQEIQWNADEIWLKLLRETYTFVYSSRDFFMERDKTSPRKYHIILASNLELHLLPELSKFVPWPERLLVVETTSLKLRIATTHIPPGVSNGWTKIDFFEGLHRMLMEFPTLLLGDFNSPKCEFPDGTLVTWGQNIYANGKIGIRKKIHGSHGQRWHDAEFQLLKGITQKEYRDYFRELHGYQTKAQSWITQSNPNIGYRFDHMIGPSNLHVSSIDYDSSVFQKKLSDHKPLIATFIGFDECLPQP
jgi:exonuclease III